jgi:NADP-dependent 3-hydroxy acid dehydrogenase YdfG
MSKSSRWKDRVAVVTGASSGIGWSVVEALVESGLLVVGTARRADRLEELGRRLGDRFVAVPADLRDVAAIEAMFSQTRDRFGGVDVLINNAGLGHNASLCDGDAEQWREMLDVNVLALCVCTREAIRDMRRRGVDDGHVIHISSMAAHRVPAGSGVYSASKFAVRSLTEGLRQELRAAKSSIRVTAISPGFVETEFAEHYHQSAEMARKTYSRFKVLDGRDVANSVLFALEQPSHVQIHDLLVRPTDQPS